METDSYSARVQAEKAIYEDCAEVHRLPAAFHYWSNRYLRPKLNAAGFDTPDHFFAQRLDQLCSRLLRHAQFVSLGAGNCDLEIQIALHLRKQHHTRFTLHCLELNEQMLARGRQSAIHAGVEQHLVFTPTDLNHWRPNAAYDAVLANQSLHHLVELEHLFTTIRKTLHPDGEFLISDMIGRNGHQRWPEALQIMQELWRDLPPAYRYNTVLNRYEETFLDWDCSLEGFEGVRSQDILPLLADHFHFRFFFGFGNLIDPFTDRSFGPHFERLTDWDRAFLDHVHHRNEEELSRGTIKPTHMIAVASITDVPDPLYVDGRSPRFSVRHPHHTTLSTTAPRVAPSDPYNVSAWPANLQDDVAHAGPILQHFQSEVDTLRTRLGEKEDLLIDRTAWARNLERIAEERTAWAQQLDRDIVTAQQLTAERTAWAQAREEELAALQQSSTERIRHLEDTIETRTSWAQGLDAQLAERTRWAFDLQAENESLKTAWTSRQEELDFLYTHPLHFLVRYLRRLRMRLR